MADRLTVGKQFFADMLARIPEDRRAIVQEILESPDAQPVVEFAGDSTLRQADYSRAMNELSDYKKQLDDWFGVNRSALEAAAAGTTVRPTPSGQPTPTGVSRKEMEDTINERERGVATYIAAATDLSLKHFQEFGERLNLTDLLGDPEVQKVGILGVYDRKYADRYKAKAETAENDRVNKKVQEQLAEERKKFAGHPYPVTPNDPSPLDALEPNAGAEKFSPQAAADEYNALVARRQGTSA